MKLLLLLALLALPGCASYESTVASRSVAADYSKDGAALKYSVSYR